MKINATMNQFLGILCITLLLCACKSKKNIVSVPEATQVSNAVRASNSQQTGTTLQTINQSDLLPIGNVALTLIPLTDSTLNDLADILYEASTDQLDSYYEDLYFNSDQFYEYVTDSLGLIDMTLPQGNYALKAVKTDYEILHDIINISFEREEKKIYLKSAKCIVVSIEVFDGHTGGPIEESEVVLIDDEIVASKILNYHDNRFVLCLECNKDYELKLLGNRHYNLKETIFIKEADCNSDETLIFRIYAEYRGFDIGVGSGEGVEYPEPNSSGNTNTTSRDNDYSPKPSVSESESYVSEVEVEQLILSDLTSNELVQQVIGRVVESFPDTMFLNQRERLSILISSDTSQQFMDELLEKEPLFKEYPERVEAFIVEGIGKIMSFRLIDADDAFEIKPLFDEQDRYVDIANGTPQQWEWYVTPVEEGTHTLTYALERIKIIDNKELPVGRIPVVEKDVIVVVAPTTLGAGNDKPNNNLLWIIPLALLSIAALIFFFVRKKKEEKEIIAQSLPISKIRNLVAASKTDAALSLILSAIGDVKSTKRDEAILLKSRWSSLESELNKGTIDHLAADIQRNKINDRILEFIEDFEEA